MKHIVLLILICASASLREAFAASKPNFLEPTRLLLVKNCTQCHGKEKQKGDLPLILAGGGFKHGGHVDAMRKTGTQTPLNNLFTTMLQNFGVEIDRFNGTTGTFTDFQA